MRKAKRKWFEVKGQMNLFYRYLAQATYQSVVFGIDGVPTKYGYANGGYTEEVKPGVFVKVGEGTQANLRRQRKAGVIFVGAEVESQISEKQKARLTETIRERNQAGIEYKAEVEGNYFKRWKGLKKKA